MIKILFKKIELTDKPIFDKYFHKLNYAGSECTFTNLFIWRDCYGIKWYEEDESLFINVRRKDVSFFLPPFTNNYTHMLDLLKKIQIYNKGSFAMHGIYEDIREHLEEVLPNKIVFNEDRDNFDYIYDREKLAVLSGRKYHSKKNHVNAFKKLYPEHEYQEFTEDLIPEVKTFLKEWCLTKNIDEDESLRCEMCAISEALSNMHSLDFRGAIVRVNGKVEAFTMGEKINNDTAVIHVEKANSTIRGLYPFINQEFCKNAWHDVEFINREEDMGLDNLKKAKESYYPVYLLKKYSAKIDLL